MSLDAILYDNDIFKCRKKILIEFGNVEERNFAFLQKLLTYRPVWRAIMCEYWDGNRTYSLDKGSPKNGFAYSIFEII